MMITMMMLKSARRENVKVEMRSMITGMMKMMRMSIIF